MSTSTNIFADTSLSDSELKTIKTIQNTFLMAKRKYEEARKDRRTTTFISEGKIFPFQEWDEDAFKTLQDFLKTLVSLDESHSANSAVRKVIEFNPEALTEAGGATGAVTEAGGAGVGAGAGAAAGSTEFSEKWKYIGLTREETATLEKLLLKTREEALAERLVVTNPTYSEERDVDWKHQTEALLPHAHVLLLMARNKEKALEVLKFLLVNGHSLWEEELKPGSLSIHSHHFNNYLLTSLRYQDIEIYKKIVGEHYGVVFIGNSASTLHRIDKRSSDEIFLNGFQLRHRSNPWDGSKYPYTKTITLSFGISTSERRAEFMYPNPHNTYIIRLPDNHGLLAIDCCETARKRSGTREKAKYGERMVSTCTFATNEKNFLDPIPPAMVYSLVISDFEAKNPAYDPHARHDPDESKHSNHGCY
jgi:hypothetical protein